ncbi:NPCBM/NEW2 domain-containing protein [Deinococcus peraridilitoris]|uniref:Putative carbohydrate binding protein n=1 Tax=Deinococcus peraridilitoris (strain DSM 19664 / LMG 22246 / CIP 109416 / KR-200) TaxID=937777 RepID=L0A5D9_DEIPD|nr:NPCBM/NEW2 domain-containing protein [Deinococcus peraridilitoris]AFZ68639.1 putative carbohydrate binding protein [Deinococcus peraridilitoris DSM 19664]
MHHAQPFRLAWVAALLCSALSACSSSPQASIPDPSSEHGPWTDSPSRSLQPQRLYKGELYLSDLSWTRASSGFGPVERDRANGTEAPDDGGPLIIEGQRFSKGLGVHSNSEVVFPLGGTCTTFNATIGLNDFKLQDALGSSGSVVFQVYLDGTKVYDSGLMRGNSPARYVDLSVRGINTLRLVTTDAGDGRTNDHADWAVARVNCGAEDQLGIGLGAQYFATPDLSGSAQEQVDATVNYDWLKGAPFGGLPADGFSVRWSGRVQSKYSETYTFTVIGDDGVRLWVNGQKLIDSWTGRAPGEQSARVTLSAGQKYDLTLEYADFSGDATARLLWSSPSQPREVIPRTALFPARPSVTSTIPNGGATGVRRDSAISASLYFPTPGAGVDRATLEGGVRLYRSSDPSRSAVPGMPGTDGADGNITFQPTVLLDGSTEYTFEVTNSVKDQTGAPFIAHRLRFTTGTLPSSTTSAVNFSRQQVYPDPATTSGTGGPIASITVDRTGAYLYGVRLDGKILRWPILSDGRLGATQTLELPALSRRAIIGMRFDPLDAQVLWLSHNDSLYPEPARDFTGKISRLRVDTGVTFAGTLEDYVVGLPRSIKDHMSNSLAFGPDGKLYLTQGSMSAAGDADGYWVRAEHLLSGAVLQIDARRTANLPIDVQTEDYEGTPGTYNPLAEGAPVKVFASGVRNAYDLVWHTNGFLYLPTNGTAAGGNAPASPDGSVPALTGVPTQPDFLYKTKTAGAYFGHPNPRLGHYVLNGGNPTSAQDVAEVVTQSPYQGYPVGVRPDSNYRAPSWTFGFNRSPNGAIEYRSNTFGGALKNRLLVVEYANGNNILALTVNAEGNVSRSETIGIASDTALVNPLDLAEDGRNGNLYVAELVNPTSSSRIVLLKPAP